MIFIHKKAYLTIILTKKFNCLKIVDSFIPTTETTFSSTLTSKSKEKTQQKYKKIQPVDKVRIFFIFLMNLDSEAFSASFQNIGTNEQ